MREYARVVPRFWTGPTGRRVREAGRDAQVLALYLFTGPASTMLGLYYLALPTLCHEAGFTEADARRTLRTLADLEFAYYDEAAELVWVTEAARYQIADHLVPTDKRVKGIVRELAHFRGHRFARLFYGKYRSAFSLPIIIFSKGLRRPLKPLASQEQEQEQEQENEHPPQPPPRAGGADPQKSPKAALDRLVKHAGAMGIRVDRTGEKALRRRLRQGDSEDVLRAGINAQAEEIAAKARGEAAADAAFQQDEREARAWIQEQGGEQRVIDRVIERPEADDPFASAKEFLAEIGAPTGVYMHLLPPLIRDPRRERYRRPLGATAEEATRVAMDRILGGRSN